MTKVPTRDGADNGAAGMPYEDDDDDAAAMAFEADDAADGWNLDSEDDPPGLSQEDDDERMLRAARPRFALLRGLVCMISVREATARDGREVMRAHSAARNAFRVGWNVARDPDAPEEVVRRFAVITRASAVELWRWRDDRCFDDVWTPDDIDGPPPEHTPRVRRGELKSAWGRVLRAAKEFRAAPMVESRAAATFVAALDAFGSRENSIRPDRVLLHKLESIDRATAHASQGDSALASYALRSLGHDPARVSCSDRVRRHRERARAVGTRRRRRPA